MLNSAIDHCLSNSCEKNVFYLDLYLEVLNSNEHMLYSDSWEMHLCLSYFPSGLLHVFIISCIDKVKYYDASVYRLPCC